MAERRREIFTRLLLLLGSILAALALAEIGLRIFFPVRSSSVFPRYLIDGHPAASFDYYTKDPQLPFTLRPGYRHTLADLAWHPVPYQVTLDGFGYRNQKGYGSEYDLVVVGDSVAFGLGVDDEKTISAQLGRLTKTYSLAIPGAGPEMYMVMIDRFFRRAHATQVAVLFYEGNDYQNLVDAHWAEIATCSPPGASRIIRKDQPIPSDEWVSSLAVVALATDVAKSYFSRRSSDPCELLGMYYQVSAAAIADLDNFENYDQKLKENVPRALSYLRQLAVAPCVDEPARRSIDNVIRSIIKNDTEGLASRMRNISAGLAGRNCYPIGNGFPDEMAGRSLIVYANYYAGFYYDYLSSIRDGYDGNLRNFQVLLGQMETWQGLSSEYARISRLKMILADRRDTKSAAEASAELKAGLSQLATTCVTPTDCDKEGLFLSYLDSLRSRKIEVTLFTLPSENALSYSWEGSSRVCRKASAKGIKCLDLYPRLAPHYRVPGKNGFYLDGAHLSVDGSAKVAQWMAVDLGLNPEPSGS